MLNSTVYIFHGHLCLWLWFYIAHIHNVDIIFASRSVLLKSVLFHMVLFNRSIISWHSGKNTTTFRCCTTWASWRNYPLDGEEPLNGFEQGSNMNIFAVVKGHSGLRLGKRLKQRATKAVRTQKSNTVVAVQTKNDGNSDMGVEGHGGNRASIKKDDY